VGGGQAHKYLGNYEDYVRAKAARPTRGERRGSTSGAR
jgi:hypothetical protein